MWKTVNKAVRNYAFCLLAIAPMVAGMAATPLPDKHAPAWRQQMAEGDRYKNARLMNHAIHAYQQALSSPEIADSVEVQLRLLRNLLYCYDVVGYEKQVLQMNYRLYNLATKHHSLPYEAIVRFMWGKRTFYSEANEGVDSYQKCLEGIQMMKRSDYRYKDQELQNFYGHLAVMYMEDRRYEDALRASQEQERIIRKGLITDMPNKDKLLLYRTLSIRCHLLAKMGRMAEADSCYAVSQRMGFFDVLADKHMISYLQARQRYADMLQVVRRVKALLREDGDSVSVSMTRVLRDEAVAHEGMGDFESSVECYKQMAQVFDSIRRESVSLTISSVEEALEKERTISRHNILLMSGAAVVFFLIVLLVVLIVHDRLVSRRNRLMASTMSRLVFYKERMLENSGENTDEMDENEAPSEEKDELQQRFLEMDYEITKDKLFCRPDFGRDDLTRMMGVDKNTLPGLIARFTGTNVVWYVNSKRMDYAASLMKSHPEYTLNAIAEACGIKSPSTFISNFKTTFGMTPSEYRKTLENTPPKPKN